MTNQQRAFERDTDEIAPTTQPTDAEMRELWEAVERLTTVGGFDCFYQPDAKLYSACRVGDTAFGSTPHAALIALAAKIGAGT